MVTINITIDGNSRSKPPRSEFTNIIQQAGLDLGEVTGTVGRPGYLEVSLIPAAVSVLGAIRETPKQISEKIMITSVAEKGVNRVVVVESWLTILAPW